MSKRTNQTARAVMKLAHSIKAQFATFALALKAAWAQIKQPRLSNVDIDYTVTKISELAELAMLTEGFSSEKIAEWTRQFAAQARDNFENFKPYKLLAGATFIITPTVAKSGLTHLKWEKF